MADCGHGRAWRIEYEGALYHVVSRGNEGRDIFFDNDDRHMFLNVVEQTAERFEINVFANEKIGSLFEVTYSSVSHSVKALRLKLEKDRRLRDRFSRIYSLFKI